MTEASSLSFLLRSRRRLELLKTLKDKPKTQAEIKKITGMYKSHTSRGFYELEKKGLIKCQNPKDRAYKFYEITVKGRRLLSKVNKIKQTL